MRREQGLHEQNGAFNGERTLRTGFTPTEEVADLYANLVASNFDNTSFGIAKKQWVIKAFEPKYYKDR